MKQIFTFCLLFTVTIAYSQVGIGTTTPAASAQLDVTSGTKGFLPPRMDSNARKAIIAPAAGLTIYNTSINGIEVYNGVTWTSTVHYIGESYGGGIVFFVYDNGQHGLIAATSDQSTGIRWNNGTARLTGSTGDGLGAGAMNTALIIATQLADNQTGNFAAKTCADYSATVGGVTYGDWYLPSKYELNLLYLKRNLVPGLSALSYWSSTEFNNVTGWRQFFNDGWQLGGDKASPAVYVRAIRAF